MGDAAAIVDASSSGLVCFDDADAGDDDSFFDDDDDDNNGDDVDAYNRRVAPIQSQPHQWMAPLCLRLPRAATTMVGETAWGMARCVCCCAGHRDGDEATTWRRRLICTGIKQNREFPWSKDGDAARHQRRGINEVVCTSSTVRRVNAAGKQCRLRGFTGMANDED